MKNYRSRSPKKNLASRIINAYQKSPALIAHLNDSANIKSKTISKEENKNNFTEISEQNSTLIGHEQRNHIVKKIINTKINDQYEYHYNIKNNLDKIQKIIRSDQESLRTYKGFNKFPKQENNNKESNNISSLNTDNDKATTEIIKLFKNGLIDLENKKKPKLTDCFIISNESDNEKCNNQDLKLEEIKEDIPGEKKVSQEKKVSYMQEINPVSIIHNQEINMNHSDSINENHKMPVIRVENVHKTYLLGLEGVAALRGVSLDVYEGEFVCIFGNSGGGKTTLLNIMGTIDKPSKGNIYISGTKVSKKTSNNDLAFLRLSQLAFVFQTYNLIPSLTAIENIELPLHLKGKLSNEKIREVSMKLLKDFRLESRGFHYPNQLSGGEQQRVTIARAIASNPKILLLDEPTGDLDSRNSDLVMKILIDLNMKREKKITIIMVTHDLNLKNFGTKIVKMIDGKIGSISYISEADRNKAIEELSSRIFHFEKEYINIQTGILNNEYNSQKEKEELEKAKDIFPNIALNKPNISGNTKVRLPNSYAALCMTNNKH